MEKANVCRGCFSELEKGIEVCPQCGWQPSVEYPEVLLWKVGEILEKRYLLGNIFYQSDDAEIVVWRIYDNILRLPCFVLIKKEDSLENLRLIAKRLEQGSREKDLVVLALKKVKDRNVLLFSMRNQFIEKDVFQKILDTKIEENENWSVEPVEVPKKEQVLPVGSIFAERYKIIDYLGIGGFGITYLCEDIFLHRLVTLKEYFPAEWVERDGKYVAVKHSNLLNAYRYGIQCFLKEIRISASFIHTPNLVTVYDAIEENDTYYMVMKYIPGNSIGRIMRSRDLKPFAPLEMADIILPVLDALEVIHNKRIIHSDISPGNIIRVNSNEICLIDMGAAKYNIDSQPSLSAAFLKIDYAAPEQYRTAKEGKIKGEGPWTDIYALGATMYYLLVGNKPTDVISRLSGKDTDLSSTLLGKLPVEWIELLQKSMALDRTDRFQSVGELREEILKIL